MKSETEILGEIDQLLAQLPDDAARGRAVDMLRARHGGPRSSITQRPSPFQHDVTAMPIRDPAWPPMQVWVGESRAPAEMLARLGGVVPTGCGGGLPPAASGVFIRGSHQ